MRRTMSVLGVLAVVLCSASAAQAGPARLCMDNIGNNNLSPTATTGGRFWIDTGDGPVLVPNDPNYTDFSSDINLAMLGSATPTGLTLLYSLYSQYATDQSFSLKDLPAGSQNGGQGCMNWSGPPGEFMDLTRGGAYVIPDTTGAGTYYIELRAWTGSYSSISAAAAAGEYVADSGVFSQVVWASPSPINNLFQMPAVILKHVLPGDANLDGTADISDLSKVLTNYDRSGMEWSAGDFNNDGSVNITDLSKVLTNYDKSVGSSAAGIKAVPEPSSVVLLATLSALAGLLSVARHRGSR
jgi:hypothetical protein